MALFLSTVTNKVDKKGRVSVPSEFRDALADEVFKRIVAFRAPGISAISASGEARMETYVDQYEALKALDPTADRLADFSAMTADACRLAWGDDGRIVLPPQFIEYATINDEASFVGQGRFFLICTPDFARSIVEGRLGQSLGSNVASSNLGSTPG